MLPDEKKLRLINLYALAIISFVTTTFSVYMVMWALDHLAEDSKKDKEMLQYKDRQIEISNEQKYRTDEIERASRLLKGK